MIHIKRCIIIERSTILILDGSYLQKSELSSSNTYSSHIKHSWSIPLSWTFVQQLLGYLSLLSWSVWKNFHKLVLVQYVMKTAKRIFFRMELAFGMSGLEILVQLLAEAKGDNTYFLKKHSFFYFWMSSCVFLTLITFDCSCAVTVINNQTIFKEL